MTAPACASSAATSGASAARSKASPPIRVISTSSCRRASARRLPVEVDRHAFAYVFEGSGNFRFASQPFGVLTEKSDGDNEIMVRETDRQPLAGPVRPRRRSHRAGRRRGHSFPARLRQAARRAGGLARPDRDEHAGRAAAGVRRTAQRHVHQITAYQDPLPLVPAQAGTQRLDSACVRMSGNPPTPAKICYPPRPRKACGREGPTRNKRKAREEPRMKKLHCIASLAAAAVLFSHRALGRRFSVAPDHLRVGVRPRQRQRHDLPHHCRSAQHGAQAAGHRRRSPRRRRRGRRAICPARQPGRLYADDGDQFAALGRSVSACAKSATIR